MLSEATGGTDT